MDSELIPQLARSMSLWKFRTAVMPYGDIQIILFIVNLTKST